ncbi:MAG: type II toxin-antitoxin system prevent-host-death family antitoxin [Christensenellaceae bacterium]
MSETMIPLADLQDKFDDILKIVDETNEPVFLTKDRVPDLVLLSMEAYKSFDF